MEQNIDVDVEDGSLHNKSPTQKQGFHEESHSLRKPDYERDGSSHNKSPTQKQEVHEESHSLGSLSQKRKLDDDMDEDDSDDDETEDDDDETGKDDADKCVEHESSCFDDDYEGSEQQQKDYEEYLKQVRESDGFDVEIFPRFKYSFGALWKISLGNRRDFHTKECKKAVKFAIKEQNKDKGANLELVKIIKALNDGYAMFYATVEAMNKTTGEVNIYQTSVYRDFIEGGSEVEIFRLKKMGDEKAVEL